MKGSCKAFTLVEALAAVALIAVGIVATLNCLSAMAKSRTRVLESEQMQRLAFRKYDQILIDNTLTAGRSEGDFREIGEDRFIWRADRQQTDDSYLDALRVQVIRKGDTYDHSAEVQGLVYKQKANGAAQ